MKPRIGILLTALLAAGCSDHFDRLCDWYYASCDKSAIVDFEREAGKRVCDVVHDRLDADMAAAVGKSPGQLSEAVFLERLELNEAQRAGCQMALPDDLMNRLSCKRQPPCAVRCYAYPKALTPYLVVGHNYHCDSKVREVAQPR